MIALNAPPSDTRERPTAASTAPLPDPRPGRRGQAPKPRSGAPKAQGLTAAIAVVAPSAVPSIALDFTGVKAPIDPSTTSQIYTSLTDVTAWASAELPRHWPKLLLLRWTWDVWNRLTARTDRPAFIGGTWRVVKDVVDTPHRHPIAEPTGTIDDSQNEEYCATHAAYRGDAKQDQSCHRTQGQKPRLDPGAVH